MTSLSETPCAFAAAQWNFSAPPDPSILPLGHYTITHASYPGKCLTADDKNVAMSSSNCKQAIWYFGATNVRGNMFYYINYVPTGLTTPKGVALFLVSDSPSDCDSATQLVYSNDNTGSGVTAQIILGSNPGGAGNTIFDGFCKQFFVPIDNGSVVVSWDGNDPKIGKWAMTPVSCPTPAPQPTGIYIFSFQDAGNVTQYLSYTLNDPSWGNFMSFTSTFSLNTCAWSYDSSAKTLSTGCGPTVFYLGNNFTEAVLTTDVAAARKDVVVGASSIFLGTYQALTPSNNSRKSINVYSCLSPKAMLNIIPVSTPPPPSVDSGNYNIKFNGKCLFINGAGQVVLDTCPNVPTVWRYNKTDQTLSVGNQCLTNNSAGCAALQNLVMGPCGGANTKRFVLGTNNKIYDPLLGMCYTPTSPVMQIQTRGLRHVKAEKSTTYWIIAGVSASVVLLLVSLGLVYIFRQGYVKGSVTVTS